MASPPRLTTTNENKSSKEKKYQMIMIRSIVRPEKVDNVLAALMEAGFPGVTKMSVVGRGKQRGIKIGEITYDEIPKEMLLTVSKTTTRSLPSIPLSRPPAPVTRVPSATARSSSYRSKRPTPSVPVSKRPQRHSGRGGHMKELIAVVRMNMMNKTKQALAEAGLGSITARDALGRGKGIVDLQLLGRCRTRL
jgi:nitrogen regulatory protein PII